MEWIILMALIRPGIPSNMPTYTKQTNNVVIFWQKGKEKKMEMEKSNRSCPYRIAVVQRVTELLQGVQKLDIVTGLIG